MTAPSPALPRARHDREALALAALVAGAFGMGLSPVFVRYADVGPFTSAFYRVFLSLPVFWAWARVEARRPAAIADPGWTMPIVLAGVFFAGDLFFWHLSILRTSLANATLLATMAPVWVACTVTGPVPVKDSSPEVALMDPLPLVTL